jgi:hexosaminidase
VNTTTFSLPAVNTRKQLDVGRKYYPPEFIIEMCAYLSFFKQNVFHLHLSDNLWNDVSLYSREQSLHDVYAAFRPWSDDPAVSGLNKRANESYTQAQFDTMQRQCARRGVTVIPEIEAPGHALVIVQWKPELGLADLSMLNISYPETIPTMKTIWNTFLPWFHSKTVHIGADEYNSSLVDDYTRYVNQMNDFIQLESGKAVRIWGTFTPKEGANVSTEVSIQHWTKGADNPYVDYIRNGYHVLNSNDWFYVVGKWSEWYPQELNATRVFYGNPDGGSFAPNIFDLNNATYNAPRNNPMVQGQLAAVWNDNGPNATTVLEAYYSVRDVLPAMGDKQWGGDLTEEEYNAVFNKLHAVIPGQNLDRSIPSRSDTILHYSFDQIDHHHTTTVRDLSGNGYNGRLRGCRVVDSAVQFADGCYLETPLTSKGRDYTLSFWIKPTSSTPGTLFAGPDSALLNGNGSITNITLTTGGNPYSLNYSLPLNTWTHVSLIGRGNATLLTASDEEGQSNTMEFLTDFGTLWLVWAPIAIVAPLARIGEGFTGFMKDIVLTASAE